MVQRIKQTAAWPQEVPGVWQHKHFLRLVNHLSVCRDRRQDQSGSLLLSPLLSLPLPLSPDPSHACSSIFRNAICLIASLVARPLPLLSRQFLSSPPPLKRPRPRHGLRPSDAAWITSGPRRWGFGSTSSLSFGLS